MIKNFFILLCLFFILEFYIYQGIKLFIKNPLLKWIYWVIIISIYASIIILSLTINRNDVSPRKVQIITSIALGLIVPKLLITLFLLIEDIFRIVGCIFHYFTQKEVLFPPRRKFVSILGFVLSGIFSIFVFDGIIFGKYRHKARIVKVKIKNLPENFKGYKIVQISDVHSGSFFNPEKLRPAIHLINQQNPNLVLFTGDMVNVVAEEFQSFVPLFSEIKSTDGKFSVLGNHDYGGYFYSTKNEKEDNVKKLIDYQNKAGFRMLRNEHISIEKNGEKLYIIGVENWGIPPFPQYGDLNKAVKGIPQKSAKILMSHDPTHFDEVVKSHPSDISLTLSGHTHGMQFGLDFKRLKWSPVQYRYSKWADLYESMGKYLYVNRGFGVIGFPGRVGVEPEITVFILE